jgi:hypothetical protein
MAALVRASPLQAKYGQAIDRESAYEKLAAKVMPARSEVSASDAASGKDGGDAPPKRAKAKRRDERDEPGIAEKVLGSAAAKAMLRSAGAAAGATLVRSLFGTARRRR